MTKWTVHSAAPNNGIVRVHLTQDSGAPGQPSEIFINATSESVSQAFMVGDVWGVTFNLIYRPGTNGPR